MKKNSMHEHEAAREETTQEPECDYGRPEREYWIPYHEHGYDFFFIIRDMMT